LTDDDDDGPSFLVVVPDSFGNPGGFDDNIHGHCSRCGVSVHWRPHNPPPEVMPRVCMLCLYKDIEAMPADEPLRIMMTGTSLREAAAFIEAEAAAEAEREKKRKA